MSIIDFTIVLASPEMKIESCNKMRENSKKLRASQREEVLSWVADNYPNYNFVIHSNPDSASPMLKCSGSKEIFHRLCDCRAIKRVVMSE